MSMHAPLILDIEGHSLTAVAGKYIRIVDDVLQQVRSLALALRPSVLDARSCIQSAVEASAPLDHRDVFFSSEERHEGEKMCACVSRATGVLALDM
mgnify:CR=1 FL=1